MDGGAFPTIISIITLFLIGGAGGFYGSFLGACILVGIIILGVFMTLLVSRLLSATLLKGVPSSFTLEMPPYRKPQILKVIIRSIVDRTIKVLGRAMVSAAPAGLIIWILANVHLDNQATLLTSLTGFLDPFARALGMDGCILTGFLLGLPANEIVVPIIIMTYMAGGSLIEIEGAQLLQLFEQNGITVIRTGLHAVENGSLLAGPWHPAFGELCAARVMRQKVLYQLQAQNIAPGNVTVTVPVGSLSKMLGQRKENIEFFRQMGYNVFVLEKQNSAVLVAPGR